MTLFLAFCKGYISPSSVHNLSRLSTSNVDRSNERKWLYAKKARCIRYPTETITNANYADDVALLENTPTQVESLLHSLEKVAECIGFSVNSDKTEYIRGSLNKFPDFFVRALLLVVHTRNSSPLRSNPLRLQCTCCTVPKTSGTPHGSPLVWACQSPSSQPLSSPQLSHNDSLWA